MTLMLEVEDLLLPWKKNMGGEKWGDVNDISKTHTHNTVQHSPHPGRNGAQKQSRTESINGGF